MLIRLWLCWIVFRLAVPDEETTFKALSGCSSVQRCETAIKYKELYGRVRVLPPPPPRPPSVAGMYLSPTILWKVHQAECSALYMHLWNVIGSDIYCACLPNNLHLFFFCITFLVSLLSRDFRVKHANPSLLDILKINLLLLVYSLPCCYT